MHIIELSAYSGNSAEDSRLFGRIATVNNNYFKPPLSYTYSLLNIYVAFLYKIIQGGSAWKKKTVIDTYEDKRKRISDFNLVSDLFAGKVFEDIEACQELCRILLQNDNIIIKKAKTQYIIKNLENHSVSLDIFVEDSIGSLINIEIQMYKEPAPLKRSRYYMSSIDTSILEKGIPYHQLPDVTMIYITKEDFIGGKLGYYNICRKSDEHNRDMCLDNGRS